MGSREPFQPPPDGRPLWQKVLLVVGVGVAGMLLLVLVGAGLLVAVCTL
jgi:hypothetical protein